MIPKKVKGSPIMKKVLGILLVLCMLLSMASVCAAEEQVTISFQTWNPGDSDELWQIIDAFEAEHPNIKIDYIYMPYSDHIADMQIKMNNGEGPDVYGMQTGATYNEFREYEVDLTPYAEATYGEGWQSKFLDFCMNLLDVDGKYYGLPLGLTYAGFLWADVEMLDSYGLKVPTNYTELKEVCAALRENGELPLTIGAKDDWINVDTWLNIANDVNTEMVYAAIEGEQSFTEPDMIKSFEIWQNLFTDGIFQDGCLGVGMYTETTDLWDYGGAALCLNGSWAAGQFVASDEAKHENFNHEGANHDVFLMDWDGDGDVAGIQASIDVVLCMNSNSEHKDEAWEFIDYMLHNGQDVLINQSLQYCPSRTDLELDVVGLSEDGSEALNYIVEQSKTNIAGYREMAYADLKQAICDALKALGTGEMTPEEAGAYVQAASEAQVR